VEPQTLPDQSTPVWQLARRDPVRLLDSETVGEALERLRGEELSGRIIYFYVVDAVCRLVGVVPTRKLLLSPMDAPVGEIMIHPVISIGEAQPFAEALRIVNSQRLLGLPVVDDAGRLTGMLDITDYVEKMVDLERGKTTDDVFQLVGVHMEQADITSPGWVVRHRFPWLLANVASGLTAAVISGFYNDILVQVVALAFFIPLVLTIAESVAMQSVTLSLQSLHLPSARRGGIFGEMRTGLLLGVMCGVVVAAFGVAWMRDAGVPMAVALGMSAGAAISAVLGYSIPRIVHRWNLNPNVASGPAALALTDVATTAAYLGIATAVLRGS
jgi:magnesium transporter